MTLSNRMAITEMAESQNNREVTVNEAFAKLESGSAMFGCVSIGDTSPPGSPAEGDQYVVGASPTGAWTGKAKYVANFFNGAWIFIPPLPGAQAYAADEDAYYYYSAAGSWGIVTSGGTGDVVGPGSAVDSNVAAFNTTTGKLIKDGGVSVAGLQTRELFFLIDGGGAAITTGIKGDLPPMPFACTILDVTLLADQSGSIVIDIWKDTYANFPPTIADTIVASAKPTLSSATKSQDSTLTGWTTAVAAGDILRFNVDSAATLTRVTLGLKVRI
ncbi:hypothetical protein DPM33_15155 [Mesorhizobium hawassense]|uniref:DUF2793 domain-containing protein n=1 Tax=Mesorhizobium hawassense TaxID=1209954 RepID=A0A330HTF1_9HYPH|nr:DUF2793 domain-containing protein [Mesorhizobium hawassense]RAZ90164.1 hypothetical protein DPM33_15155 [Mesorhizobium hawassense]